MAIGLSKDQRFRYLVTSGEDVGEFVPERADNRAYLVGVDHRAVELRRGVLLLLVFVVYSLQVGRVRERVPLLSSFFW